jgi:hypothetical protein
MTDAPNRSDGPEQVEAAPEAEAVAPQSAREIFNDAVEQIRSSEDLEDKDRRRLEKTVRRIEANYEIDRLDVRLETRREIDALSQQIITVIEGNMEEDAFAGENVDDLKEVFDTAFRKEQVEDHINGLDKSGLDSFEGAEVVQDLSELSLDQLLDLETKYEGVLLYAFTDFVGRKEKLSFEDFQSEYQKPSPGQKFQVDFRGNVEAENEIGAGELLPPAVRRITVYANGDKQHARTSVVRRGLKGRNNDGEGFFDNEGYMPVFSGDVMEIGGSKKSKDGVDHDFEAKFRKPDGSLDFEAYLKSDEYKAASDFVDALPAGAQSGKRMTPEEIDAFMEAVDAEGNGKRIVDAVHEIVSEGKVRGDHCWDWVHKVYKRAGMSFRRVYQDLNYTGKDCGEHKASPELLNRIEPGDWLYVNNKNKYDTHGNHSVVFLGWIDKGNLIARTASCPGAGKKGKLETRNLEKHPVVHISKPVPA